MNIKILNHRIAIISILFIFAISVQLRAQDTIYCFDERYHWTEPCNYSDYPDSIFEYTCSYIDFFSVGQIGTDLQGKPICVYPTNKVLTQQVFTDTVRKQIYGIAGTTIGCYNPNGCYFYLYKKARA